MSGRQRAISAMDFLVKVPRAAGGATPLRREGKALGSVYGDRYHGEIEYRTFTAEYTVNSDCTASYEAVTSAGPVGGDIVIAGDGDETFVIRTDPGQVITFTNKRQ